MWKDRVSHGMHRGSNNELNVERYQGKGNGRFPLGHYGLESTTANQANPQFNRQPVNRQEEVTWRHNE